MLECISGDGDDHPTIEEQGSGEPQMEGVVDHASEQDEPTLGEIKITLRSAQVVMDHFISPPIPWR